MTDPTDTPPKAASVSPAQRALEMKRNAAKASPGNPAGGRKQSERDAAARSASKSKPALRK
jgi:hypothetical protein